MSKDELHMAQITFDARKLWRAAKGHGLGRHATDLGYLAHAQMAALFGELSPKPFSVRDREARVEVLGYTTADQAALRDHAQTFAEPDYWQSCTDLATKPMPGEWQSGRRLGFEVLACPVVRKASAGEHLGKGKEQDVFLQAVGRRNGGPPLERHGVYLDWLGARLEQGGAALVSGEMARFQLIWLMRKKQGGRREGRSMQRPKALLRGQLEVRDPERFEALLRRGIGRHRAFGFGMLLLRPC